MKYLKLFEQFEDEENWWDDPDPYMNNELMIFCTNEFNGPYYLGKLDSDMDTILFFENLMDRSHKLSTGWKISKIDNKKSIVLYDYENKYKGYSRLQFPWKSFKIRNLPKEIKDRII